MNQPADVHRIAGVILEFVQRMQVTPETLVAALNVASSTVNETATAQMLATMRAHFINKSRGTP